ncbi:hypothetical protein FZEAL_4524 [Fusarium zealandicum]|uniref:Tautomerase cis-CaaD-like domain-containing protein n=1 Tax=Fusarium zealandicum TaxID=1053134 RepID=A0A8H4XLT3_9HYPO|nr:hypothetical protein FZEAL_4524 [Fusarium zealandicum]
MPFNRWYYPAGSLSQGDKDAIAKGITDIYAEKYPRHSTLVIFIELPAGNIFVGGEKNERFHRITLQHMSGSYDVRTLENDVRVRFREVWKPYVDDRGFGFELQIEEIPAPQISFHNYMTHHILAEPLFEDMIKQDEIFPVSLRRD